MTGWIDQIFSHPMSGACTALPLVSESQADDRPVHLGVADDRCNMWAIESGMRMLTPLLLTDRDRSSNHFLPSTVGSRQVSEPRSPISKKDPVNYDVGVAGVPTAPTSGSSAGTPHAPVAAILGGCPKGGWGLLGAILGVKVWRYCWARERRSVGKFEHLGKS